MTRRTRYFIEPLDVLFLRGNRLFGDPGSFGESLVPPWPSVAAGAVRSALLASRGHDAAAFARGEVAGDPEIGTPANPGAFTVTAFDVARRDESGGIERLHAPPADLIVHEEGPEGAEGARGGATRTNRMTPRAVLGDIASSAPMPLLPVLPQPRRGKPASGRWLTAAGWSAHLRGRDIQPREHLVSGGDLWTIETRVGIALDPDKRSAAESALFTTQAVALRKRGQVRAGSARHDAPRFDVGFLVEVGGVADEAMPDTLTLRFGGDGRAALATRAAGGETPRPDYEAMADAGRCRLILTAPGVFAGGWLPAGAAAAGGDARGVRFDLHGVAGRIVCAAVPRAEVISGFDLARRRPKPAQRAAPAGSVYWLDDLRAAPEALHRLARRGLWSDPAENEARRAEGFNRLAFAEWRD